MAQYCNKYKYILFKNKYFKWFLKQGANQYHYLMNAMKMVHTNKFQKLLRDIYSKQCLENFNAPSF